MEFLTVYTRKNESNHEQMVPCGKLLLFNQQFQYFTLPLSTNDRQVKLTPTSDKVNLVFVVSYCKCMIIFGFCCTYFFKENWRSWANDTPILDFWWHLFLSGDEFQSQGRLLACLLLYLCAVDPSDSPPVQHLLTSWQPVLQSTLFDLHTGTRTSIGETRVRILRSLIFVHCP